MTAGPGSSVVLCCEGRGLIALDCGTCAGRGPRQTSHDQARFPARDPHRSAHPSGRGRAPRNQARGEPEGSVTFTSRSTGRGRSPIGSETCSETVWAEEEQGGIQLGSVHPSRSDVLAQCRLLGGGASRTSALTRNARTLIVSCSRLPGSVSNSSTTPVRQVSPGNDTASAAATRGSPVTNPIHCIDTTPSAGPLACRTCRTHCRERRRREGTVSLHGAQGSAVRRRGPISPWLLHPLRRVVRHDLLHVQAERHAGRRSGDLFMMCNRRVSRPGSRSSRRPSSACPRRSRSASAWDCVSWSCATTALK